MPLWLYKVHHQYRLLYSSVGMASVWGDIHFAKIQITLDMWTVMVSVLERWVESRRFNPERKSPEDFSRSTAILIVLTLNQQGTALTYASIGLIV